MSENIEITTKDEALDDHNFDSDFEVNDNYNHDEVLFEETQPKHHLPFHDLSPVGRLTKDLELYIFQKWQEAFLTLHVWDFCWIFNKTNWPPLPFMSPQKQYQSSKL